MRRSSWLVLVIAGIALLLLGGRAFTALFVNKAWFAALNAEPVFWEQVTNTVLWRGGSGRKTWRSTGNVPLQPASTASATAAPTARVAFPIRPVPKLPTTTESPLQKN